MTMNMHAIVEEVWDLDVEHVEVDADTAARIAADGSLGTQLLHDRGWIVNGDDDPLRARLASEHPELSPYERDRLAGYVVVAIGDLQWLARQAGDFEVADDRSLLCV